MAKPLHKSLTQPADTVGYKSTCLRLKNKSKIFSQWYNYTGLAPHFLETFYHKSFSMFRLLTRAIHLFHLSLLPLFSTMCWPVSLQLHPLHSISLDHSALSACVRFWVDDMEDPVCVFLTVGKVMYYLQKNNIMAIVVSVCVFESG